MPGARELQVNLTRVSDNRLVIELIGDLDERTEQRLHEGLTGTDGLPVDVVIDMARVDFVDSQGLSALVRYRRRTDPFVTISVRAPNDHVRRLLKVTALDALFPVVAAAES